MIRRCNLPLPIVVAVVIVCGGITFALAQAARGNSATPELEPQLLRQQVETLESRVAELERRLMQMTLGQHAAALDPLARGWVPHEFNGQRYYDVPLDGAKQPR